MRLARSGGSIHRLGSILGNLARYKRGLTLQGKHLGSFVRLHLKMRFGTASSIAFLAGSVHAVVGDWQQCRCPYQTRAWRLTATRWWSQLEWRYIMRRKLRLRKDQVNLQRLEIVGAILTPYSDYYSQCQPGAVVTTLVTSSKPIATAMRTSTAATPSAPAATGTPAGSGPGTTLQSGYYWIRGTSLQPVSFPRMFNVNC